MFGFGGEACHCEGDTDRRISPCRIRGPVLPGAARRGPTTLVVRLKPKQTPVVREVDGEGECGEWTRDGPRPRFQPWMAGGGAEHSPRQPSPVARTCKGSTNPLHREPGGLTEISTAAAKSGQDRA